MSNGDYLQTLNSSANRKYKRGVAYVPKFSGYFYDDGSRIDEQCIWIEPEYFKRYVNILERNGKIAIEISLDMDPNAIEYEECESHRHAELYIELVQGLYASTGDTVEIKLDNICYINVLDVGCEIVLNVSKERKPSTKESIGCIIGTECDGLLMNMQTHYSRYKDVRIENEIISLLK